MLPSSENGKFQFHNDTFIRIHRTDDSFLTELQQVKKDIPVNTVCSWEKGFN